MTQKLYGLIHTNSLEILSQLAYGVKKQAANGITWEKESMTLLKSHLLLSDSINNLFKLSFCAGVSTTSTSRGDSTVNVNKSC